MAAYTLIEGYLYKNKKFKPSGWSKKWYIIHEAPALNGRYTLDYYADESKKKLSGQIELSQSDEVAPIQNCIDIRGTYRYAFKLKTPKQEYFFAATSQLEMTKWVSCLSQVCGIKSDTSDDEVDSRSFGASQSSERTVRNATLPQGIVTSPSIDARSHFGFPKDRSLSDATPVSSSVRIATSSTPSQKRNLSDENPYIHLRNCISSASSKPLDHTIDTLKKRSVEKELSIPDDFAPPPPIQQSMDDEGVYKSPPQCVVYDSKDAADLTKRWSGESDTSVPAGTYDTPPSRTPSVWARSRQDFENIRAPSPATTKVADDISKVEILYGSQVYDVVPSSTRSPSRQASAAANFSRRPSLINEPEAQQYAQVPKPKVTLMKHCNRLVPPVSMSSVPEDSVYDRPPSKGLSSSGSHSAPRISPRPSLSSTSSLTTASKENAKNVTTPPTVDRNSKPAIWSEELTSHLTTMPRVGHARRIGSPPSSPSSVSVGLYNSPSILTKPEKSRSQLLHSKSLRSPLLKNARSTSEEDLTLKGDYNNVDFAFRRHTGTRTLPRQRRPPDFGVSSSLDIEYTDVDVSSTGSGQVAGRKLGDSRKASLKINLAPAKPAQISPRSPQNVTIDYKLIDPLKTQALHKAMEYRSIGNRQ